VPALGQRVHGGGSSRRRAEQQAAERMLREIAPGAAAEPSP
jgi:dsRNA-specific ribonuclease